MRVVAIVLAVLVVSAVLAAQNDPAKAARELYASAAYEEALAELTRAGGSATAPEVARDMDAYRAFCLVALGRTGEAEKIAESLVRKDPLFTLDRYADASPRIAAMFAAVRTRVLPQVIRDEYRTARSLVTEKSPEAKARLSRVHQLLDEARKIGAWDDTLADLKLLVDGFLELSREAEPAPAPAAAATNSEHAAAPVAVVSPPAPLAVKEGDAGVVSPVVVSQTVPRVPPALFDLMKRLRRTGTIDVVIDERGTVEDVVVTQSVNSAYDTLLVAAARTWRYRPALKDGVPVRFVKTVAINVQEP